MSKLPTLDVGPYDPWTDTITIEGIRYAGELLRQFGHAMIGSKVEIVSRSDGTVALRNVNKPPAALTDAEILDAMAWHFGRESLTATGNFVEFARDIEARVLDAL